MEGLITNREWNNVLRRGELLSKGYGGMSDAEKAEWSGDPFTTTGANLLPRGPNYSSAVQIDYSGDGIIATTNTPGVYLYAISIIGAASDYQNIKTLTLSVDNIRISGNVSPQLSLYWHDDNGFEYAGANLTSAGSVTFDLFPNANNRANLSLYIYVTTDGTAEAGDSVRFDRVMLEVGGTRHPYSPYAEVLATPATKGAYNYSDLNRVERAVAELSYMYGLNLTTKTDWRMWDIPRHSDMERYLNNIKIIRNVLLDGEGALPESMNSLSYADANNIEAVLAEAFERAEMSYRSGEIFCGEV